MRFLFGGKLAIRFDSEFYLILYTVHSLHWLVIPLQKHVTCQKQNNQCIPRKLDDRDKIESDRDQSKPQIQRSASRRKLPARSHVISRRTSTMMSVSTAPLPLQCIRKIIQPFKICISDNYMCVYLLELRGQSSMISLYKHCRMWLYFYACSKNP